MVGRETDLTQEEPRPAQMASKTQRGPLLLRGYLVLGDCALVFLWFLLLPLFYLISTSPNDVFVNWAVFSSGILCISNRRKDTALMVLCALPFWGLSFFLRMHLLSAILLALGCGGVVLLIWRSIQGSETARENLRIGVALPIFVLVANLANVAVVHFTPHVYDALLLKADFGIGDVLRSWTSTHSPFAALTDLCYQALPLVAALAIAASSGRDRARLLWSLCLAALLAVPCYFLFPAVGPAHVVQPGAARNCMPSLHFTWAALLWVNTRPKRLRGLFLVFVGITAFTTLATGEHYVLDLVAALPFTCLVQWLSGVVVRVIDEKSISWKSNYAKISPENYR